MSKIYGLGIILYVAIGFVQFFALIAGVQAWLGIHWILSGAIAMFLAYMPVIGTITGIMGAVRGWGWSYPWAIAFFCWPYLLFAVIALGIMTLALIEKAKAPAK